MAPDWGLGMVGMSLAAPGAQRVRSVEPAANGGIQIVLDETRQRTVSGGLDDQNIRVLLLSAAKDPSDPGLRYETVGILNDRAQTAEVRDTLIYALQHDENAGVRLKAMDGLKPFVKQPEVRKALAGVAVDATLRQAGYRPTMVDSAAAFESALGRGGWDLVLVGLADAEAVSKRSKNVGVLPVVVNPTAAELQQTRKLYPVVLKVPAKGPAVLEAVDDALTARSKQKSSRTAS